MRFFAFFIFVPKIHRENDFSPGGLAGLVLEADRLGLSDFFHKFSPLHMGQLAFPDRERHLVMQL
jgi:hypothetical protein